MVDIISGMCVNMCEINRRDVFQKLDKDHRQKLLEKKMEIASLSINQHFNRFSDVLPCKDLMRRLRRMGLLF